jgi:hypothetical protein
MARFRLTAAFHHNSVRHRAGSTIADSAANALAGDVVWTGMNSGSITADFVALDAAAVTMKNASPYASTPAATTITGVSSIDA